MTNNLSRLHLQKFSRALIMGIHAIFPPPEISGHQGEDPISQRKLHLGEATWSTTKELLGWLINGVDYTIQLDPERCKKIVMQIKKVAHLRACPLLQFQKVAGKLQHASFGIPGGKGLFSPIYRAMQHSPPFVTISPHIKQTLLDWRTIIHHLAASPTPVRLLVPNFPDFLQYTDACGLGCGGVLGPGLSASPHVVWQYEWPPQIKARFTNGLITIMDLELAAMLLGYLILEITHSDLALKHVGMFCDNTAAVTWTHKGCATKSIPAARILRFLSLRQRTRKTSSILPLHISGVNNIMADISSRAFKTGKFFAAHDNLLSYFSTHFPLPQTACWTVRQVPKKFAWRVTSCLLGEALPMESLTRLPRLGKSTGGIGARIVQHAKPTPSYMTNLPSPDPSSSRDMLHGCGRALTATELKSQFRPLVQPWQPSRRPLSWEANVVPPSKVREATLLRSVKSWRDSAARTHLPSINSPSPSPLSSTSRNNPPPLPTPSPSPPLTSSPLPSTISSGLGSTPNRGR